MAECSLERAGRGESGLTSLGACSQATLSLGENYVTKAGNTGKFLL